VWGLYGEAYANTQGQMHAQEPASHLEFGGGDEQQRCNAPSSRHAAWEARSTVTTGGNYQPARREGTHGPRRARALARGHLAWRAAGPMKWESIRGRQEPDLPCAAPQPTYPRGWIEVDAETNNVAAPPMVHVLL